MMIRDELTDATSGATTTTIYDTDAYTVTLLVNGVQQSSRAMSGDEVAMFDAAKAARQADANRQTIDAAITNALAELQQIIDGPTVPPVPAGTLTTAQLSNGLRTLRDEAALNRAGVKRVAATLRHTIRLVRGDYEAVD